MKTTHPVVVGTVADVDSFHSDWEKADYRTDLQGEVADKPSLQ